jgi:ArsR family transcriptional regulator
MSLREPEADCASHDHVGAKRTIHWSATECDQAAAMFRMLGDASRLRVVAFLANGEICVSDLAEQLGEPTSNVSHRLRLLKSERLVTHRRAGKHVYYKLADDHILQMVNGALEHAGETSPKDSKSGKPK